MLSLAHPKSQRNLLVQPEDLYITLGAFPGEDQQRLRRYPVYFMELVLLLRLHGP